MPLCTLRTANLLYELEDKVTTIGRDPQNDLVLEGNGISRFQATLYRSEGQFYLLDHGSTNGTFVNGCRIAADTGFGLRHGDIIFFSAYERTNYRFELPGRRG